MVLTWGHLNEKKRKMRINSFILLLFFFLICFNSNSQNSEKLFSIFFYNVENYFHIEDDPNKEDDEFLPRGSRRWNSYRFNKKTQQISKVVLNTGGWEPPEIITLCEIENRRVLEKLIETTPLKSFGYKIIHKESPDMRGIDVALLYRSTSFNPTFYKHYPLQMDQDSIKRTREILHVSGVVAGSNDTIHIFVNHWPSRYSGLLESEPVRVLAAETLASKIEELKLENSNPKIIVIGDFNDQPTDKSLSISLNARKAGNSEIKSGDLYNLSYSWINEEIKTQKFQSQWSVFDQIIVSGELLKSKDGIRCSVDDAKVLKLPFLLETDERYGGLKPKRTYIGYKYNGGFSDHLPILLQLKID